MTTPHYIAIDLETTSREPEQAHVVEWAALVSNDPLHDMQPTMHGSLVKPPVPIPPETSAIHHIIDEDVEHEAGWVHHGALVYEIFRRNAISYAVAHNVDMERKVLAPLVLPCIWICTYRASLRVWPDAPSHSNEGLRYWLKLGGGRKAYNRPHTAPHDAKVTAQVFEKLIEAGATLEDMMQWTNEPALLPRCPIGDWRGKPWAEVDDGFLHWILRKIFDRDDVRFCAQKELDRREAEWKAQQLAQTQEQAHELEYRSGALF
jgi:exodeoxyribonuclease X